MSVVSVTCSGCGATVNATELSDGYAVVTHYKPELNAGGRKVWCDGHLTRDHQGPEAEA